MTEPEAPRTGPAGGALDALDSGLVVVDDAGVVRYANPAARRLLGREDLVGRELGVMASAGNRTTVEIVDEVPRTLELSASPTSWEGGDGVVIDVHDVTSRAQAIEELHTQLDGTRLAIAGAGHELRSPLSVILGSLTVLIDRGDDLAPSEVQRHYHRMHRQAQRMRLVIDNILTAARLDAGRISPQPDDGPVLEIVERAVRDAAPDGSDVDIDVPADLAAHADPDHIALILLNLLSNAEKYGRPPVVISGHCVAERTVLRVRDHGDGVPRAFIADMFGRFTRAEDVDTNTGTGLGLSLAQTLAEVNDGELRYEAAHPGAVFVIDLPQP